VRTVPRGWTSLATVDPVEVIAAGRAPFRADDLMRLADLLDQLRRLRQGTDEGGQGR